MTDTNTNITTTDYTAEPAPAYKLPCAYHLDKPGIGQCVRCEKSVCNDCFGHDMRGMLVCKSCRLEVQRQVGPPWETPGDNQVGAFFTTMWSALSSPTKFSHQLPAGRSWAPAVFFGLVCIVGGLMVATMWEFLLNPEANDRLLTLIGRANMPPSALRAMAFARAIVIAPLIMLFHILTLHATLNLLGVAADRGTVARIFGFACSSYAFLLIPPIMGFPIGYMLMIIWLFNIEAHGIQRFFDVSSTKATFIVLVPTLLGVAFQCY